MKTMDKNEIVKEVLNEFEGKGFEITHADYGGHKKPEQVDKYRPDVVAWDNEKELYHVATVTYAETFDDSHTKEKIRVLSNLIMGKGHSKQIRIPFYLAMPKGELEQVDEILDEKNIDRHNILPLEC